MDEELDKDDDDDDDDDDDHDDDDDEHDDDDGDDDEDDVTMTNKYDGYYGLLTIRVSTDKAQGFNIVSAFLVYF